MDPKKQQAASGPWVMGSPVPAQGPHPAAGVAVEYVPSAKPSPYVHYPAVSSPSGNSNPYVQVAPVPASSEKSSMDTVLKLLGRCGKKLEEGAKRATETTGNVWHHLKTSPSVCDAAMARLAQGTKVLAEGGNDKIFQQTFGILTGEQLRKSFACYISTSSGPVIGTLCPQGGWPFAVTIL